MESSRPAKSEFLSIVARIEKDIGSLTAAIPCKDFQSFLDDVADIVSRLEDLSSKCQDKLDKRKKEE